MTRHRHGIELPESLSDESAAQILDFLYEMIRVFESRYFTQIRRHQDAVRATMGDVSDPQPREALDPLSPDTDPF